MTLKETLTFTTKGNQSVVVYLSTLKSIIDEIAIIATLIDNVNLIIHFLNGVGFNFKKLSAAI